MGIAQELGSRSVGATSITRGFELRRVASGISLRHVDDGEVRLLRQGNADVETRIALPVPVSAVIFAAEEVLYDSTDWWRWVIRVLVRSGVVTHYEAIYRVWRRDYLDRINATHGDYWTVFEKFLRAVGCQCGQVNEILTTAIPRRRQFENDIRVARGVAGILSELHLLGIRVGIFSCAPLPSQQFEQRLLNMGLMPSVDWCSTAWQLGASTYEPESYRLITHRMGVEPGDALFVGRDGSDVAAAEMAGIVPVSCGVKNAAAKIRISHLGALSAVVAPN
jgi:FMN phosphatase YigB (HAD superfamily)